MFVLTFAIVDCRLQLTPACCYLAGCPLPRCLLPLQLKIGDWRMAIGDWRLAIGVPRLAIGDWRLLHWIGDWWSLCVCFDNRRPGIERASRLPQCGDRHPLCSYMGKCTRLRLPAAYLFIWLKMANGQSPINNQPITNHQFYSHMQSIAQPIGNQKPALAACLAETKEPCFEPQKPRVYLGC